MGIECSNSPTCVKVLKGIGWFFAVVGLVAGLFFMVAWTVGICDGNMNDTNFTNLHDVTCAFTAAPCVVIGATALGFVIGTKGTDTCIGGVLAAFGTMGFMILWFVFSFAAAAISADLDTSTPEFELNVGMSDILLDYGINGETGAETVAGQEITTMADGTVQLNGEPIEFDDDGKYMTDANMDADTQLIIFEDGSYELAKYQLVAEGQQIVTFTNGDEVIRVEHNGQPVDFGDNGRYYVTTFENGYAFNIVEGGEYELTKTVPSGDFTVRSDGSVLINNMELVNGDDVHFKNGMFERSFGEFKLTILENDGHNIHGLTKTIGGHEFTAIVSSGDLLINYEPIPFEDGKFEIQLENDKWDKFTAFQNGEHNYEVSKILDDGQEITRTSDGTMSLNNQPLSPDGDGEYSLDDQSRIVLKDGQFKYVPAPSTHRRLAEFCPSQKCQDLSRDQQLLASQCLLGLSGMLLFAIFYAVFKIYKQKRRRPNT